MAGGNLGDLWFNLGIKDGTSKGLRNIIDKLKKGEDVANAMLRALQGFGTKKGGFNSQAEKAKEFADVLNAVNRELVKLRQNNKLDEVAKLQKGVNNALNYLDILQRINIKQKEISELRSLNPNVDTSKLKEAESMLENLKNQMLSLQNKPRGGGGGGVDVAEVISSYAKALTMTLRDVKDITDKFKKDNPLSTFSGGAAKVEADISRVTEKLAKLRDLMSEGTTKGYNTSMLGGNITELGNLLARLQSAQGNKNILTDEAQMKNLLSDVAVGMTKATSATQAYGREKGKVIAQEREHDRFLNESRKSTNDASIAYDRLSRSLKELGNLSGKGLSVLGVNDTTNIRKSISELLSYQSILEQIKNNGGFHPITGQTARDITSSSEYKKAIDDAKEYAKEVKNSIKEVEKAREDAKKKADAAIENQKKLDNGETAYYAKIRDILQQIDTLSKGMTPLLNATANRGMTFPSHLVDDLKKLYSVQQTLLANNHAGRNMGLDWLKDFQNRNGFSAITKELKDFIANAEEARKRYVRLFDVLNELRNTRAVANIAGVDTSKIDSQIASTLAALKELRTIMQTGIGDAKGVIGSDSRSVTIAGRVNKEVRDGIRLEQKRQQEIAQTGAKIQADLVRGFERANSHAGKLNSTVQDLKSLFLQGGLVFGAQQFAMSIITTGGEMEKQHIALQSILGDMQNANTMFGQIKELALNSPFTFSELNRDVKQLAAYGVEYDQLYDTTKRLADMSSGLGVSFDRIALAFGQVQARGWLDGKELRQIAYAGIPLLNKLSEFYSKQEGRNVSTSEIKTRISNREVSFDDVKSIFWQMTDAGGQFYNMQQTLSETLLGRYNKLKDAWEIMLSDFASGSSLVGSFFKTALDGATALVQVLHSLAPMVTAAFSGYALTKLSRIMGGNAGSAYLTTKGKLATDVTAKIVANQQLNSVDKQILATKNQITGVDLRNLIANKAITKVELQRLLVAGKISTKQYQIYSALLKQQGATTALNTNTVTYGLSWMRVGVSAKLALNGIETAARGMWAAIGGLPGLIMTGVTMAIAKLWGDYTELTSAIKQTNEELADRQKRMNEFRNDNDVKSIVASKDAKEIDNAIDAYEEKLKELSPYEADLFVMNANERKSHEDRLKYLEEQLKLIQEANKVVQNKLSDRDNYSDLQDLFESARRKVEQYSVAKDKLISFAPDKTESDTNNFLDKRNLERWVNNSMGQLDTASRKISEKIAEIYRGVKAPKAEIESMQKQTIESYISGLNIPENQASDLRLSIYKSLGLLNGALKVELGQKLAKSVADSMPEAANAIRSGRELDEASKEKMKELAKGCIEQMKTEYPRFANELQGMLNASNFQAIIRLIYTSDSFPKFTEAEQSLYDQYIPAPQRIGSGKKDQRFNTFIKSLGGAGKNATGKDLNDAAYQKLQKLWETAEAAKVGKYDKGYKDKTMKAYLDQKALTEEILGIKFVPTYNKSNKPYKPGKNGGHKEDSLLKELQERLSSLKSARQMYQKFKPYMSDDEAKKKTYKMFPNVVGLDLDNYAEAVDALIKNSKFKATTPERRKFLTSTDREKAEWKWDEVDKPAIEVQASERNAYMNRLSSQWDLYKTLLEKTGNKRYAESAWIDAFQMDDKSKSLMDLYYQNYGKHFNIQEALNMSDEEAKKTFKSPDEYNEWKKIVDLLRNNYVQSLQDGADAIQQTMSVAQKLDTITENYAKKRKDAGANQDLVDRYDFLEKQEKSGVLFDQMKSEVNWDGVFGNLGNYTKKELKKVRKDINNLISGGLLNGMSTTDIKSIYDGLGKLNQTIDGEGFSGLSDLLKDLIDASAKYDEAVKDYNETVKKYGKDSWQAEQARKGMQQADLRRRGAQGAVNDKKLSNANKLFQLADMFRTLGSSDGSGSTLLQNAGSWTTSIMNMFGSSDENSKMVGGIIGMFAGLTEAIAKKGFGGFLSDAFEDIGGAVNSIFKDVLGINLGISGADYSDYNDAKAEYDNLVSVWDSLISKKTEYMSIHWGTEATEASKEAQAMLQAEIEQTKIIAKKRLSSGASMGSHSIDYRMWKGSYDYNGQNWRDVAPEISSKYGVQFNSMSDLLNMNSDVLSKIKTDFTGLWANMDSDYRDYLEKLIEYGDKADDMIDNLTEKLTGNKFSSLVESWGDAMATMANSSDNLVDNFENNLKKTILNSMIENIYGNKIKALLEKTQKYAENGDKITDGSGNVISEYTGAEYADVKESTDDLAKQIEATRDYLKKTYGWSDNSSSSSTNSVKGITEEEANLGLSYLNSIRLDCSVMRAEQAKFFPEMSEIAKSQLTQLNQIAQHTLRNADAAERIETVVTSFNDNFNRVINGTKVLHVK